MTQKLSIPAWLLGAAIFAQVLIGALNLHLIWKQSHQPQTWSLDSTTFYKVQEGQGKLNLRLYEQQQSSAARIDRLEKKRQARHRHIDSLSGPALQSEIDRQYNRPGRQQPANGAGGGTGPETNSANRSGRAPSPQRQSRPDFLSGLSEGERFIAKLSEPGFDCPKFDDYAAQSAATAKGKRNGRRPEPDRKTPEAKARSQVGKLGMANRRGRVPGDKVQGHWLLIQRWNYTYPDVAFAISAVETGYFVIQPGNNLFGMKKNSRHFYIAISPAGYCLYASQAESLADYKAYEQQVISKYSLRSRTRYLNHIQRRYCPSPAYRRRLDLAFQKLKALA